MKYHQKIIASLLLFCLFFSLEACSVSTGVIKPIADYGGASETLSGILLADGSKIMFAGDGGQLQSGTTIEGFSFEENAHVKFSGNEVLQIQTVIPENVQADAIGKHPIQEVISDGTLIIFHFPGGEFNLSEEVIRGVSAITGEYTEVSLSDVSEIHLKRGEFTTISIIDSVPEKEITRIVLSNYEVVNFKPGSVKVIVGKDEIFGNSELSGDVRFPVDEIEYYYTVERDWPLSLWATASFWTEFLYIFIFLPSFAFSPGL